LSESIEKAIQSQTEVQTRYLGEQQLKNVRYPVRVYAIQGVGLPEPDQRKENRTINILIDKFVRLGIFRVILTYFVVALLVILLFDKIDKIVAIPTLIESILISIIIIAFPIALYLAWNYEKSPIGFVKTTSRESLDNPYTVIQRKPFTSNLTIFGLLAVVFFLYFYPDDKHSEEHQPIEDSRIMPANNSIAVLPLKNLSGSDENLYFSDGVMEAILNNLSMISDLKVISRTSVERYRDKQASIREIAQELEVGNILEGSVQRVGDEVRITVQLISAETDEHLWANNFDRQLTDIFELQSEIAQTIADNLEVIMTTEEQELIKNAPTSNLMAYDLYLKANYISENSEADILNKIKQYEHVIELDPDFGLAYGMKARQYAQLSYFGYPKSLWYDSALLLLHEAIARSPKMWLPYYGLAIIHGWFMKRSYH
jgi:TolB-like protein